METLRIDFGRDAQFTTGKDNWASCTVDGKTFAVGANSPIAGVRGGGVRAQGGVIYRLIVELADAGYCGRRFLAHDGRMVCLEGTIDKLNVPVRYGGQKKGEG